MASTARSSRSKPTSPLGCPGYIWSVSPTPPTDPLAYVLVDIGGGNGNYTEAQARIDVFGTAGDLDGCDFAGNGGNSPPAFAAAIDYFRLTRLD